jgi:hypothetical protein
MRAGKPVIEQNFHSDDGQAPPLLCTQQHMDRLLSNIEESEHQSDSW